MMAMLEHIAVHAAMRKVMLTAFTDNAAALAFYARHGYARDASSPTEHDERVLRYVILSKSLAA